MDEYPSQPCFRRFGVLQGRYARTCGEVGSLKMTKRFGYAVLALSGFLASCQTYDVNTGPRMSSPKPAGIDGEWVDSRGINTATFSAGTFTSFATDTGKVAARGSYSYRDQQNVDLAFTSMIRNTTVNAACLVVMPSQMNCTTSSGATFTLVRKGATPGGAQVMTAPTPMVKPLTQG